MEYKDYEALLIVFVESGSREDSRVGNNIVDIKVWR